MTNIKFKNEFLKTAQNLIKGNNETNFIVDSSNEMVIDFFCSYMSQDLTNLKKLNGKSYKGIMIIGTNGSGKSFLFEVIDKMYNYSKIKSLRIKMFEAILFPEKYRRYISNPQIPEKDLDFYDYFSSGIILIDDLGAERKLKHFGNEVEVIDELIQLRYYSFKKSGRKTFVTTNLSLEEIKKRYDPRTYDRIFEMFNILQLNGPTRRK